MPKKLERQLDKLDPKLRMVANGSEVVNTLRAERTPNLAVLKKRQLLRQVPRRRDARVHPISRDELPRRVRRGHLKEVPGAVYANVFLQLAGSADELPPSLLAQAKELHTANQANLMVAAVPLNKLPDLLRHEAVISIESAEAVDYYPPLDLTYNLAEPTEATRHVPNTDLHHDGAGVLLGIIDVQGFDFAHSDFLDDAGQTRFLAIWDQGGSTHAPPAGFGYGSELTREQMNAAIAAQEEFGLPATELEPQSQMVPASHGTHVASIAAGRRGVCRRAEIAAVLISLPQEDVDRRRSFYDSSRIVHAVDYLFRLGQERGLPVSINISLGTNGHAHDASSVTSRWIDYALATPGRSVCVAAGNAGQEAAAEPGDWGFVMGRIHTGGRVRRTGQVCEFEWVVLGDGLADLSENELEIWYSPHDRFAIEVKPPEWPAIGPLAPGQFVENQELPNGTFISIYNELYSPANGHNYIACYLSPFLSDAGVVGVRAGTWTVRLHGLDVRDGTYHAWIERDDPRRLGRIGFTEAWSFPSFFSAQSNVDNTSVSSLACGQRIISVANLDETAGRIHITSSQGPTRDGREKPDIAAPGTNIVAANGFDREREWVSLTGTSMASPYVAGVVGLMLAADPSLTAAQIGAILCRTARPLPRRKHRWRNDAGYGLVDPVECLAEVARLRQREDRTP